jgi:hypothetical protein
MQFGGDWYSYCPGTIWSGGTEESKKQKSTEDKTSNACCRDDLAERPSVFKIKNLAFQIRIICLVGLRKFKK